MLLNNALVNTEFTDLFLIELGNSAFFPSTPVIIQRGFLRFQVKLFSCGGGGKSPYGKFNLNKKQCFFFS